MVQASVIGSFAVVVTLLILSQGTPANALQEEAADSCSTPDCQAQDASVTFRDDASLLSLKAEVRTHRMDHVESLDTEGHKVQDSRSLLSVRSGAVCGAFIPGGACIMPDGSKPYVKIGTASAQACSQLCQNQGGAGCCWHSPKHNGCEFMAGGQHQYYGGADSRESVTCHDGQRSRCEYSGSPTTYRCASQSQALSQCQSEGMGLCSKTEIELRIGRACAYMWTSSSSTHGYFVGSGVSGCGVSGTLHGSTTSYNGNGLFDAACCPLASECNYNGNPAAVNGKTCPSYAARPVPVPNCPCSACDCQRTWQCFQEHYNAAAADSKLACDNVYNMVPQGSDLACCKSLLSPCRSWSYNCSTRLMIQYHMVMEDTSNTSLIEEGSTINHTAEGAQSIKDRGGKHSRISNDIDVALEDTLNRKNCVR